MPSSSKYSDVDWDVVGDEVVTHLRDLLRLDTRNPPGNETLAAEYLRGVLEQEGIACEIVGPAPNRGTIVARLKGDGSEPPLLLMSHTDVVAVEPDKWTHDPFTVTMSASIFVLSNGAHMCSMMSWHGSPLIPPKQGDVYQCNRKHSLDQYIFGVSFFAHAQNDTEWLSRINDIVYYRWIILSLPENGSSNTLIVQHILA